MRTFVMTSAPLESPAPSAPLESPPSAPLESPAPSALVRGSLSLGLPRRPSLAGPSPALKTLKSALVAPRARGQSQAEAQAPATVLQRKSWSLAPMDFLGGDSNTPDSIIPRARG